MQWTTRGWSSPSPNAAKRPACDGNRLRDPQLRRHVRRHRDSRRGDDASRPRPVGTPTTGRPTVDLSPRQTTTQATRPPVRRRNWKAIALLVVVLVAGGV